MGGAWALVVFLAACAQRLVQRVVRWGGVCATGCAREGGACKRAPHVVRGGGACAWQVACAQCAGGEAGAQRLGVVGGGGGVCATGCARGGRAQRVVRGGACAPHVVRGGGACAWQVA